MLRVGIMWGGQRSIATSYVYERICWTALVCNGVYFILQFPYCDGCHNNHNQITGDNVGPLVLKSKKDK